MSYRTGLATFWTILICVGCWLPASWLGTVETDADVKRLIPHLDKIVHFTLFLGFGLLWGWVARGQPRRLLLVVAAGLALAILTELGQAAPFVDRDPDK